MLRMGWPVSNDALAPWLTLRTGSLVLRADAANCLSFHPTDSEEAYGECRPTEGSI